MFEQIMQMKAGGRTAMKAVQEHARILGETTDSLLKRVAHIKPATIESVEYLLATDKQHAPWLREFAEKMRAFSGGVEDSIRAIDEVPGATVYGTALSASVLGNSEVLRGARTLAERLPAKVQRIDDVLLKSKALEWMDVQWQLVHVRNEARVLHGSLELAYKPWNAAMERLLENASVQLRRSVAELPHHAGWPL